MHYILHYIFTNCQGFVGGDPVFSARGEGYIPVTEATVREAAETAPEYPVDF
jgi:hypothetical protein